MYTPPPSSLKTDYSSIIEWGIFFLVLVGTIYSAFAIKGEKKSYKDEANWFEWGKVQILIANWWTQKNTLKKDYLEFHRADTNYEWLSHFEILKSEDFEVASHFGEFYLNQQNIKLDTDCDRTIKAQYLFLNEDLISKVQSFFRIEGMGTEGQEKRIYLDLVIFNLKDNAQEFYLAQSWSSVLNGCVEGPYFEEALKNSKLRLL